MKYFKIGFKWLSDNNELLFGALFVALALVAWNGVSPVLLCMAFHHYRHYNRDLLVQRQRDLLSTLFEQNNLSVQCIGEFITRLLPLVKDDDEIYAIMRKYNIDWEQSWVKYNDKWPPGPPSGPKKKEEILILKPVMGEA